MNKYAVLYILLLIASFSFSGCATPRNPDGTIDACKLTATFHFNDGLINQVELFDEEKNIKEVCEFDKNKNLTQGPLEHCSSYEIFENW